MRESRPFDWMHRRVRHAVRWGLGISLLWSVSALAAPGDRKAETVRVPPRVQSLLQRYCVECHDADSKKANLDLTRIEADPIAQHSEEWEKVVRKLQARQMPPAGRERPDERAFQSAVSQLAGILDRAAARSPDPGRVETFRRLNRTEYRNAIRDLLAVEIDAASLLPKDDASHGFDNQSVGTLSPTLLNRYVAAAEKISRLALGTPRRAPGGDTYRTPPDLTQEEHVEGLPLGTRGGMNIRHTFPRDGEYEVQIRLTRDRNEHVEGMREAHELELLVDRAPVARFTVSPPKDNNHDAVDAHLKARISVSAGAHQLGVTFRKKSSSLLETKRQPFQTHYNMHRHPRLGPAIYQVSVNGPYESPGAGDSPSRRRIFSVRPAGSQDEDARAREILGRLARRAYRRPVTESDVAKLMEFYRRTKLEQGFEGGIESALSALLVSPEFLFRIERDPKTPTAGGVHRLDDIALASRLSFFLWSSIPDDALLASAERGDLHKPVELERQTRRMLADPRAENLVVNFGEQWLHLRNLESITPDLRLFPDFDDNLRQAFRRETELHLEALLREDRSILDLLRTDHTYLNERLAKHYGIPNVQGSQFRKVALGRDSVRGGLLRQGGILTVTSYATRTSPVLRGKWVLENILGTPPPPPPQNVPDLKENTLAANLSVRERLSEHRANAQCAACHRLIDPPGFALENFDAVGRWRYLEEGKPVDALGGLPDGSEFRGIDGLEAGLLKRPELFATALTEKLLTFALGRGVEPGDGPAVRRIVKDAQADHYRLSRLIVGITQSTPFTLRKSP